MVEHAVIRDDADMLLAALVELAQALGTIVGVRSAGDGVRLDGSVAHTRADVDDLLDSAAREIGQAAAPVITRSARTLALSMVAAEIHARDLVPRGSVTDQPTACEVFVSILRRLEDHARKPLATASGAHDIARKVGIEMGVYGADRSVAVRRTRAQIEADRDARWERDKGGRSGSAATRSAAKGRQR